MNNNLNLKESEQSALEWQYWAETSQILNPEETPPLQFPEKVQKPKCAFKLFKQDNIVQLKIDHPEFGFKERLAYLKIKWKELQKDDKKIYANRCKQREKLL